MKIKFLLTLSFILITSSLAFAAPKFPALTGRVVDNAGIISTRGKATLTEMLATHEAQTSNQVVVVTLPSLQGYEIEEFGYQLGRHWGIGQKGKNNGVLLIVAPNERRVRIEVGYGLEGTLTDALSSQIIQTIILPKFKQGNLEQGVVDGTEAIVSVLNGDTKSVTQAAVGQDIQWWEGVLIILLMLFVMHPFLIIIVYAVSYFIGYILSSLGFPWFAEFLAASWLARALTNVSTSRKHGTSWSSGGGWSGGGGGGGFSGGGGSFGGGGGSGRW